MLCTKNCHQLQKIVQVLLGTGHINMLAACTKMRTRRIPSRSSWIPYPKVGSYVTLKTVALMFVYLFNNVNLNCSTYTKRWPKEGKGSNQGSYAWQDDQSYGEKVVIIVAEGNLRLHDPLQAVKFASESGVIVRGSSSYLDPLKRIQATYRTFWWLCGKAICECLTASPSFTLNSYMALV